MTSGAPARWYLVAVLTVAYVLSFIDRSILTLLVGPIKADLGVTDTQVSLLHGLAFAVFYTLLGIPIATLADRRNRRNIIAIGVAFWSLATAICGLARNFWELLAARIGVGVGEAALSPAAYSMIADSFPPERLNRALSVYTLGAFAGMGLALIIGAAVIAEVAQAGVTELPLVGALRPWQLVFLVVGLPGLVVALWLLTLTEPLRRSPAAGSGGSIAALWPHIRRHWQAYAAHLIGFALLGMVLNSLLAWTPAHLARSFGLGPAEAGLRLGSLIVVFCTAGILTGGWLADRWQAAGRSDAPLRVGVISAAGCLAFGVFAPVVDTLDVMLALYAPLLFFSTFAYGAAPAALQVLAPAANRAVASALYLFFLNIIGMGIGPLATALATDYIFGNELAVGRSLALVTGAAALAAALLLGWGRRHFSAALAASR
ncbi:MAG: MFS transporter [Gammaproteobacteria bacterium]|nr:MFS transporter [Gammaproteobacteria bacterium]